MIRLVLMALVSLPGLRRQEGQSMSEYALMLSLLAILGIVGLLTLGPQVQGMFEYIAGFLGTGTE